jgi:hypothetical protein
VVSALNTNVGVLDLVEKIAHPGGVALAGGQGGSLTVLASNHHHRGCNIDAKTDLA